MIYPYSKNECSLVLKQLNNAKFLSQLEYYFLQEQLDNSPSDFCNELIALYKDRVQQYLEHTTTHLSVLLKIPAKVAKNLSIGYVYSVLAQTNFYTSPFALISLFCGKLDLALQETSANLELFNFMKKYRATLGVSLGLYSIETYLYKCSIQAEQDESFNMLLDMNKTVFINLVSLWQLYQELGYTKLASIAATINNNSIPVSFLDGIYLYEQFVNRVAQSKELPLEDRLPLIFSDDENFTLIKNSMYAFSRYIQHDLLGGNFSGYFQKYQSSNPLHSQFSQLFFYKTNNGQFDLKQTKDRIKLMLRIYFSHDATKEKFLALYPSLCNQLGATFKLFQDLCGDCASSKLRLIDRTIIAVPKVIDHLQAKASLFFDKIREKMQADDQDKIESFKQIENQLQEKNDQLHHQVDAVHAQHQQDITNLETGIQQHRGRLAEQANAITQFEKEAEQKIDIDTAVLNRNVAECKEQIKTYCRNRFYVGVTNHIMVDQNGRIDMPLNQIKL